MWQISTATARYCVYFQFRLKMSSANLQEEEESSEEVEVSFVEEDVDTKVRGEHWKFQEDVDQEEKTWDILWEKGKKMN